jgi:hypothetical protein
MRDRAIQSREADAAQLAPEVRCGLEQLARAVHYARDLDCPLWDFAVEIDRLLALGMTTSDLRWLIKLGYVNHAREMTGPQNTHRCFDVPEQNLAFSKSTCFVLTDAGLGFLGCDHLPAPRAVVDSPSLLACHESSTADVGLSGEVQVEQLSLAGVAIPGFPHAVVPNWDSGSRTFLVGERLIKRFRVPSPNQEAVLDAFQEEGWPASIVDPLPPVGDQQPKSRLRDTIKCLNNNQVATLIRFRGDGTGQRVLWELVPELLSAESQPLLRAA